MGASLGVIAFEIERHADAEVCLEEIRSDLDRSPVGFDRLIKVPPCNQFLSFANQLGRVGRYLCVEKGRRDEDQGRRR
jgi:hypothetical protein